VEEKAVGRTRFVTVTLSPSLERTLVTKYLAVGYQNQTVRPERLDPSGQGVNVARALHHLECETHAIVLLGNDLTGRAYHALVAEEGFGFTNVYVDGPTCSQTYILDTGSDQETRIVTEGAKITGSDVQRLAETLKETVTDEDIVVLAGPLPSGAPADTYARPIEVVHAAGAEAVLATGGSALSEALVARPEMAVLSQLQCESFYNVPIRVQEDLLTVAHRLHEQGVERVLLEMQETGSALLVTGVGQWRMDLPDAMQGTTSGVWEALLAGFLSGRCHESPLEESLELAAAAAAYTADGVGAEFGSPQDVEEHRVDIDVRTIYEKQQSEDLVPDQS
jgi:1-phosphofructokinase family hexose kinase